MHQLPYQMLALQKKKKTFFLQKETFFSPKFFFILRKAETPATPHHWTAA